MECKHAIKTELRWIPLKGCAKRSHWAKDRELGTIYSWDLCRSHSLDAFWISQFGGSPWVTPWRHNMAHHPVGTPASAWSKGPRATKDWRPDQWPAPSSGEHFWNPHLGAKNVTSKIPCAKGVYQKKKTLKPLKNMVTTQNDNLMVK